jgi:hypothetical protein
MSLSGELGRIQSEAAQGRRPVDVLAASRLAPEVQRRASRAHLENNVAAAAALRSPAEWRRWLLTYVRQLANDEDEVRWSLQARVGVHTMRWPRLDCKACACRILQKECRCARQELLLFIGGAGRVAQWPCGGG